METHAVVAVASSEPSVFARNQFLIKRLFSLLGLFFGGYVVVHLLTNASLLAGPAMFQSNVDRIHSLGPALPAVEWTFLFLPFLFHALVGSAIIFGAVPNLGEYRFVGNVRYTLQRVTAIILLFFVLIHVWQMHHLGSSTGGGLFDADRAASSVGKVFQSALWIPLLYSLGVLSAAFHLGNGIWTAGITWGLWTSPAAQKRANYIAVAIGLVVMLFGFGSIVGARRVDVQQAQAIEDRIEKAKELLRGEEVVLTPTAGQSASK